MGDEDREMEITPKFYETLRAKGATEFELTAFDYLVPGAQIMAGILIDDGVPVGEALARIANRPRELGR